MNEQNLLVMDRNAIQYAPTSYMITKEEYVKVHPEMMHGRRVAFIFKYKKPEILPKVEALFLLNKYDNLYLVDDNHKEISIKEAQGGEKDSIRDDLSGMKYHDILKIAEEDYGLTHKTFHSMKGVELKKEIRRLREIDKEPKEVVDEVN